ncbi:WD repeat-containing protein 76-like [Neocloeon triangulifer]|uniref:WD repeat-containing protein 76-like n=1 Tax=Neocloeon triangulifer TaxID=2078957 RepID=UPI00286F1CA7|nr:WD repeat-containing protein 76-like [Neocloeon triangulifer]
MSRRSGRLSLKHLNREVEGSTSLKKLSTPTKRKQEPLLELETVGRRKSLNYDDEIAFKPSVKRPRLSTGSTIKKKTILGILSSDNSDDNKESPFKENDYQSNIIPASTKTETAVKAEIKEEPAEDEAAEESEMTEVERLRRQNIEQRMKMFEELNLGELKKEIETSFTETKASSSRRSSIFSSKSSIPFGATEEVGASARDDWGSVPRNSTPVLTLDDAVHHNFVDKENSVLLEDICCSMKVKNMQKKTGMREENLSLEEFKKKMNSLTLKEHHKTKVVPSRIYSMAVCPMSSGFVVAAGCKSGAVGLWKIDPEGSEWDKAKQVCFDYHSKPTNCITFGMQEPHLMYTTSYDGTFRRGDLEKQTFTLLYETPPNRKDNHTCWHAEIEPGVFLLGVGDGSVARIDSREDPSTGTETFRCHDRSLRTISVHPETGVHFATTSSYNKEVAIWDLRKTTNNKSFSGKLSSIEFTKPLSSAFFSPVKGDSLLTTCADDTVCVYNCWDLENPKLQAKVSHNNHTGRWITNFRAVWHLQRDDVCIIGSMDRPQRKLELFEVGPKIKPLTTLKNNEYFTTIGAVAMFHPYLPAVAAGNASGYVHVFM